jgi:hypothetical protein
MGMAEPAVFFKFQPIRLGTLILGGGIIPPFTIHTG